MKDSGLVINEFDTHQIHNYKRLSNRVAFLFWYSYLKKLLYIKGVVISLGYEIATSEIASCYNYVYLR